jgi:glutathione synthase
VRLGIVTNDIGELGHQFATTRLAWTAADRGHTVWMISVGDLSYDPDEHIRAVGRRAIGKRRWRSGQPYLEALRGDRSVREELVVDELDALLLRENPGKDAHRPWARTAGLLYGRLAAERGVLVVNDPDGLGRATSKMYLQEFPDVVRPRTLVSRDRDALRRFVEAEGGPVVLKPLVGSGGKDVFLVHPEDLANLNQIIEVISRDGFVIAQEYLPKAAEGDTRLVLMNGEPLRVNGRYCAFRRVRKGGDLRSNLSAGGELAKAVVTDEMLHVADIVRPRLLQDGMFLVGLDLVGDKLMEINVFSPGGLGSAGTFEKVDFAGAVIEALEKKAEAADRYAGRLTNALLATL